MYPSATDGSQPNNNKVYSVNAWLFIILLYLFSSLHAVRTSWVEPFVPKDFALLKVACKTSKGELTFSFLLQNQNNRSVVMG